MNSIYTAEQVQAFEKNSFTSKGDDLNAMKEAAEQSVGILKKTYPKSEFLILCGPGNNGGDGYFIGLGLNKLKNCVKFIDVLSDVEKSALCKHAFIKANDLEFIQPEELKSISKILLPLQMK